MAFMCDQETLRASGDSRTPSSTENLGCPYQPSVSTHALATRSALSERSPAAAFLFCRCHLCTMHSAQCTASFSRSFPHSRADPASEPVWFQTLSVFIDRRVWCASLGQHLFQLLWRGDILGADGEWLTSDPESQGLQVLEAVVCVTVHTHHCCSKMHSTLAAVARQYSV